MLHFLFSPLMFYINHMGFRYSLSFLKLIHKIFKFLIRFFPVRFRFGFLLFRSAIVDVCCELSKFIFHYLVKVKVFGVGFLLKRTKFTLRFPLCNVHDATFIFIFIPSRNRNVKLRRIRIQRFLMYKYLNTL